MYAFTNGARVQRGYTRILMHRVVMGTSSDLQVDHIDDDGMNSQRANLREVAQSENLRNTYRHREGLLKRDAVRQKVRPLSVKIGRSRTGKIYSYDRAMRERLTEEEAALRRQEHAEAVSACRTKGGQHRGETEKA